MSGRAGGGGDGAPYDGEMLNGRLGGPLVG
jgi:hypothetical protein